MAADTRQVSHVGFSPDLQFSNQDLAILFRTRWPELLVLLLALLTRLWGLDYHSLWFDESVSMTWARSAPEYAWDSTFHLVKDKHPPAYYLLLHYWRELFKPFGLENDDVALRLLGSLLGVLTVLGILLLARRLSGRRTALLAGGLVALAPALVWYSQELRMFQPAATALVWGAFFLQAAASEPRRLRRAGWWLAMAAALLLALYSYLFAAFALPAAGLLLLAPLAGWWRGRKEPQPAPSGLTVFVEGTTALAVTAALYLPLAFNAWAANASDGAPGQPFMNFAANLQRQLQVATVWRVDWGAPWLPVALGFFALLLLAGLLLPWRHFPEDPPLPGSLMTASFWLPGWARRCWWATCCWRATIRSLPRTAIFSTWPPSPCGPWRAARSSSASTQVTLAA